MTAVFVLMWIFIGLGILGLIMLLRTKVVVDPDWATDADHVPQGENWQKIVEAHLRAEKEQAG